MQIKLPKVDKITNLAEFDGYFRPLILELARDVIEEERAKAINFKPYKDEDEIIAEIKDRYAEYENLELQPVINATGVVVHTNLGRSVINDELLKRAARTITSYSNLEYNLKAGRRGLRYDFTSKLCSMLFKCEDVIIVNNNASAVFLVLNTFAKDKEVIVSRGELVEIGGSFRIPEVMASSGAILKEIGTTNKTKIKDYENAINDNTSMLMKVHQSNFSVEGFSEYSSIDEISALAREGSLISYFDLGSSYVNELPYSLGKDEPPIYKFLESGVDLLSFSGDKLFGSVQCGVILGKKEYINRLKENQLLRMLRVDKVTLSILNETLKAYINKEFNLIQTTHQIYKDTDELIEMANLVKNSINHPAKVIETKTIVGGGTMPNRLYPSIALAFKGDAEELELKFRKKRVIGRIENDRFILDFRSIMDKDLNGLIEICKNIFNERHF
ncbi:MAG: L-seryl-tRNA(Sec) selenium transferase [Campylobacteraceae bacterium]|nr:L-seryl-tRNA(Sec) selenium transferase [Campylobacteraceae bacterium]